MTLATPEAPLADGAVDAHDVLVALIENRIECDGSLARLPVAQDQFPLTTANRNHRIDDLDSRLQRHAPPVHDP